MGVNLDDTAGHPPDLGKATQKVECLRTPMKMPPEL